LVSCHWQTIGKKQAKTFFSVRLVGSSQKKAKQRKQQTPPVSNNKSYKTFFSRNYLPALIKATNSFAKWILLQAYYILTFAP
jgi:hypothetical protein